MLDFIRKHTRWVMLLLALVLIPSFVFMGISQWGDMDFSSGRYLAKVDSNKITTEQFDANWRQTLDQARQSQGENADIAALDTPEHRRQQFENMVDGLVLMQAAQDQGIGASDKSIVRMYQGALGADKTVDKKVLDYLRPNVVLNNFLQPLAVAYDPPASVKNAVYERLAEQRKVQFKIIKGKDYMAQAGTPDDTELQDWYDKNKKNFEIAASADVDYVVLNQDTASKDIKTPDDADLKQYYKANAKHYVQPEERSISHIQIDMPADASADEQKAIEDKLKKVGSEAKAHPDQFAELAKKYSDDAGSKAEGGELGTFKKGEIPDLDSAAFDGQGPGVREPIKVGDSYHIVNVTNVIAGQSQSFEEVKPELIKEVKLQMASENFSKLSAQMQDLVNQNSSDLENVAQSMSLPLQHVNSVTAKGIPKTETPDENAIHIFEDKQVLDTLFSDQPLPVGSNSNVIDISAGELVVMHVKARHEPRIPELSEVKDEVLEFYKQKKAQELARQDGEKTIDSLNSGNSSASALSDFDKPTQISRAANQGMPAIVMDAVMNLPQEKIPAAVGVQVPNSLDYVVAYVEDCSPAKSEDVQKMANTPAAFVLQGGAAELRNNVVSQLRNGYKIKINKDALTQILNRQ